MDSIEGRVDRFCRQWEYYCYADKLTKCRPQADALLHELDQKQEAISQASKKDKAWLLFLRGKVLDVVPNQEKTAEQALSKSIKLNPTNGDCWNTLANVLFNKGDVQGSQQAVNMAFQNKGKNKVSLRYQSVLLRAQGKNDDERRRNTEQSLKAIKAALPLDLKDPETWYYLGNAYFSVHLNSQKSEDLKNALKAYTEAEKYFTCKYHDLYVNRAKVYCLMERYNEGLRDFRAAYEIEPKESTKSSIEGIEKHEKK